MALSTNSIIHYTRSLKILKSILDEGFRVKYCVEELALKETRSDAAHPMISFCDIPLSDSKQHFSAYGKYGIGLSKDWAKRNGINPVIYIDKDSLFSKSIGNLLKQRRDRKNTNLNREQRTEILRLKSYAKNYSGVLERDGKRREYKFYDEREWRLVPDKEKLNGQKFSISASEYKKDKDLHNSKLSDIRVTFTPNDISYIIVKNTSQIPRMIRHLRKLYQNEATSAELDILFSKICSTEQIIQDF
ncbi:abortive infection system antitoxin AbiGi family protein [Sansalvadorimonas sp. 2012CJ34-2]|uniref:Abortive infection system antitoxin AbiGi family protein n=1 Tax=Parendozoicomonas callyspongiae TaxID=2942213 RepID=A0ABT0PLR5_9GAMM|nr:abortive infection system antitoxin AbiGi family protein [Sansalvadorimonas sp. 2012CJ34-2]MCL6272312.1 abortive infection system antitoxin AbiGi family protein [Sansalvadorimonas sp. 2012CJ34-2]